MFESTETKSMKSKSLIHVTALGILLLSIVQIHAVEGGLGRPISGAQINPYAGLVPPAPGFAAGVGEIYYDGSIGGARTVPIGVNLALNLDLKVSFTPISLLYIWDTGANRWNFASAVSLPLAWLEAKADVRVGPRTGQVKEIAISVYSTSRSLPS